MALVIGDVDNEYNIEIPNISNTTIDHKEDISITDDKILNFSNKNELELENLSQSHQQNEFDQQFTSTEKLKIIINSQTEYIECYAKAIAKLKEESKKNKDKIYQLEDK